MQLTGYIIFQREIHFGNIWDKCNQVKNNNEDSVLRKFNMFVFCQTFYFDVIEIKS